MRTYAKELNIKHAFTIALTSGFFQGVMSIIGWLAGIGVIVESVRYKKWRNGGSFTI